MVSFPKRGRDLAGALAIAGLLLVPANAWAQEGPPPANVRTAFVTQELMAPQLQVPGTIISRHDSQIASEIAGRVDWIAEVGTVVEAGEAIVRLDRRMLELQLQEDEAEISSLRSSLEYQRANVRRLQELAERNNAAPARVEEAVSTMEVTEQRLVQARVDRDRTIYNLERTVISAPFTGQVVERLVEQGEYASVSTVVARLVDTENLEVTAQAPVSVARYLTSEAIVSVGLGNGPTIDGEIRTIIPVGDQITRTFEIRVLLPEDFGIIGTPVRISVPSDNPRNVTAVPRDAIILRADGSFVFRVNEEDVAERLRVQTGAAQGDLVEVRGPLEEGDQVVIRGAERLQDGQTVAIAEAS